MRNEQKQDADRDNENIAKGALAHDWIRSPLPHPFRTYALRVVDDRMSERSLNLPRSDFRESPFVLTMKIIPKIRRHVDGLQPNLEK